VSEAPSALSGPIVSVVVPMLDERSHIGACLDGFAAQTYPLEYLDVIVVDGGSADGSRQIVDERANACRWVRVIDNPQRKASAAFNVGVTAALGEVVCLFSAHGVPDPQYVERSVAVLSETGAVGVGGRYLHVGEDRSSSAIGLAMVSPFGMASPHRFATVREEVDTISHPAYRRDALVDVGPFDESLERNSDYELNFRLRAAGGALVFDERISSVYRPRPSLRALGRQFWSYGRWKARVVQRHPASLKPRHLAAPAAVAGGLLSPLLLMTPAGRRLVTVGALSYAGLVAIAVSRSQPRAHKADPLTLAAAFPVMHAAWGAGFLSSALEALAHR
jgi:glycosyltransferase involved in cell wall biosynthesis